MKQLISRRSFLKAAGVTAAAASMAIGAPAASACWYGDKSDLTILYTNDVHTYIDKQSPKLTYAAIADLKQSYQNAGKDVLLVDAGDHVQGTAYGSMDEGASIIKLMNAAGYDVATPGNHEFDYGMDRAKAIMKEADFPYLSCNWVDLRTTLRVLPSVKVFVRGGRRIAFVGVTTPETFTKSTPAYFMDKAQRKYIYDIQGGEDGKENGGFLQVAGATYEIHTDIPNTVQTDEKNVWIGSATGTPRVQNVKVYDKASGSYLPLDPGATYALAGMNYTLRNLGDGFAMFDGAELIKDYVSEDYLVMSTYAMIFDGADAAGLPHLSSANSPLAAYPGYLLNYEQPYGAGRIPFCKRKPYQGRSTV